MDRKECITLIGFMGTGKSTVSRHLTKLLSMKEVDLDGKIVKDHNMAVKDMFETYGEEYFRQCESEAIASLKDCSNAVISCGGGAVIREENVANLKKISHIVLLTAAPETILKRVKKSRERPILNGNMNVEFIKELMEKREDSYHKAADIVIETDHKSIDQICAEIINALTLFRE